MSKKCSIFLNNITCIDHAYMNQNTNCISGGSFLASFLVSGEVEGDEQVVVDFSTLKKDIKNIVDCRENGFDHKLWVHPDEWLRVEFYTAATYGSDFVEDEVPQERVLLYSQGVDFDLPRNSIHYFAYKARPYKGNFAEQEMYEKLIAEHVEAELKKRYPSVEVTCFLSAKPDYFPTEHLSLREMFRYTHGLKNSTSWACQNIAHGHLSFIQFNVDNSGMAQIPGQMDAVAAEMEALRDAIDDAVFVYDTNIEEETNDHVIVKYTTEERGLFEATYYKGVAKVVILPEETTIENLTQHLVQRFCNLETLKKYKVVSIALSEGLQKGSIFHID
jgi:hypothetical protein